MVALDCSGFRFLSVTRKNNLYPEGFHELSVRQPGLRDAAGIGWECGWLGTGLWVVGDGAMGTGQ